jgi:hypothetical protein
MTKKIPKGTVKRSVPSAADVARQKILEYASNPENPILNRTALATQICGYKCVQNLYSIFTVDELCEIDLEALTMRRKRYAASFARIDEALRKKAEEGDPTAIKLAYQRLEGWSEKQQIEQTTKILVEID